MMRHERHDTVPTDRKYDEYKLLPQALAWVVLIAWSASLILWAVWIHLITPETERHWDYGQADFTPAESVYSTSEPAPGAEPAQQIPTLPEAKPLKPEEEKNKREQGPKTY